MIHVILYLLTTYCIAASAAAFILRRGYVRRTAVRAIVVLALLSIPLVPYGAVYLQTAIYGRAMLQPLKEAMPKMNSRSADIREIKVLRVWPHSATVYVIMAGSDVDRPDLRCWFGC